MGEYEIILADPAWPYYGSKDKDAAAGKHYDLMQWEDIYSMPVKELASKSAALFVWATCPLLDQQIKVFEHWGFHYRGVAFVWVKTRRDGAIIHGQGVPPTFTKPTVELLLAGTTNKRGRPFPILSQNMGQVILAARLRHSAKPDIFRTKIVELCGNRPRIELFARDQADGWDASGLEFDGANYLVDGLRPTLPW